MPSYFFFLSFFVHGWLYKVLCAVQIYILNGLVSENFFLEVVGK